MLQIILPRKQKYLGATAFPAPPSPTPHSAPHSTPHSAPHSAYTVSSTFAQDFEQSQLRKSHHGMSNHLKSGFVEIWKWKKPTLPCCQHAGQERGKQR